MKIWFKMKKTKKIVRVIINTK